MRSRIRLALQVLDLLCQGMALQQSFDSHAQLIEVDGLGQIVIRAKLHRMDRGRRGPMGCHDDHRQLHALLSHGAQDLQPLNVGQAHIQQRHINVLAGTAQDLQGAGSVARIQDFVALFPQEIGQHLTDGRVIINNQDGASIWHTFSHSLR
jgi:hypothetical protein